MQKLNRPRVLFTKRSAKRSAHVHQLSFVVVIVVVVIVVVIIVVVIVVVVAKEIEQIRFKTHRKLFFNASYLLTLFITKTRAVSKDLIKAK